MNIETHEVFGVNTKINSYSYVDRGGLDLELQRMSQRNKHISLKGESKSGKSWIRQKNFPDANVVQCRLGFDTKDIYTALLSELDISLTVSKTSSLEGKMELSGNGEVGWKLLAKAQAGVNASFTKSGENARSPVGKDINDLSFICSIISKSGRRVVIEDFHYLGFDTQRDMAHDLKALWDYGVFVTIVGVWVKRNYLTNLNPDLAGRITEVSIYWTPEDLTQVIEKGTENLKVTIGDDIKEKLIHDCFGNVGLLQSLVLETLDHSKIERRQSNQQLADQISHFDTAALTYAEQLEAVYLEFGRRVSSGIRKRKGSTNIYAYTMAAIFSSSDRELIDGVNVDTIFERAQSRQRRVQKPNLKQILRRIDTLQIDDRGKGLVVTFVEQSNSVAVVDRTVLFYRKYCTVNWPWEEIIRENTESGFEADES